MNQDEKQELFELTRAFAKNQNFPFARHIWVKCQRLGVESPSNVMDVLFKKMAEDDQGWVPPHVRKIITTAQQLNNEMDLYDFVEEHKQKHHSSIAAAFDAYVRQFDDTDGKDKRGRKVTFEGVKKKFERLEKKMDKAVQDYDKPN